MTDQQKAEILTRDLFSHISSATELETRLSMMDRLPRGYKIWTQIGYLSTDIDQMISQSRYEIHNYRMLNDGATVLQITKSIGRKNKTRLDGYVAILPSKVRNIHRILSIADSLFWTKVGSRYVERTYPGFVRIFYRQRELREALLQFEQFLASRFEIAATDMTLKERRAVTRKVTKRDDEFDSERRWTVSPIKNAFDDAEQRRQWFKSIRLDLRPVGKPSVAAAIRVTKHGLVSQDHLYELTLKSLFPLLEKIAFTKTELFSRRGLLERDYRPAKPLSIEYSADVFHENQNVRKLVGILKEYPNSSKAVYHGNPYLHISLADFADGSSFEIWVLSPRKIIFIPQAKASVPSFEKLVSYVFEQFKEGEVKEYSHA